MHRTSVIMAILAFGAMAHAAEDDLLVEIGLAPVARSLTHYAAPSLGTQAALLSGFSEKLDIGLMATFDHMKNSHGGEDLEISTLGIQGWLSPFRGKLRPQLGGAVGISLDNEIQASLHLAARARAIIELSTTFRLYAGAAAGGDMGDHGSMLARGEFGAQFLLR